MLKATHEGDTEVGEVKVKVNRGALESSNEEV